MEANRNLDGHLGQGTEVKGTLRFEGSVRIDGKFTGKVVSPATLILGPTATVDGEVEVAEVEVHGSLSGQIKAAKRTTIHASGKVDADIDTGSLVIEPGAHFNGRCEMRRPEAAKPKPERPAPGASASSSGSAAPASAGSGSSPAPGSGNASQKTS